MPNSSLKCLDKPEKPTPDFPLFAHNNRQWAKKIRGKLHYFGAWESPEEALADYEARKDRLHSKNARDTSADTLTMKQLCNLFLTYKKGRVASGDITQRSFDDYYVTCETILKDLGKSLLVANLGPDDFETLRKKWARRWGVVTLSNEIRRARVVFNYGFKSDLLDRPVKYGDFGVTKKTLRLEKARRGSRMLEAGEILSMLGKADCSMKAMILLAVNAGLGNMDISKLCKANIDLKRGWLDYPRIKTGVGRRCPLWAETTQAIKDVVRRRRKPKNKEWKDRVFITKYGQEWVQTKNKSNALSAEFKKLLEDCKLYRQGASFYSLRHVCETIGGRSKDQVALNYIMGHADQSISENYREQIDDERLQAVVKCIHDWLYKKP